MFPILLHLGPLTIRTYGAMVALAFLAALQVARMTARVRRIEETFMLDIVAIAVMTGLLGARLFYILINWSYFREHPADSFKIWEGGLVFYGGFLLGALVTNLFARYRGYSMAEVSDCLAPALAVGQGIGRWGCFFAGCCYGKPTSLPWSVVFKDPTSLAPLGVELHPVQLYESAGDFVIAFILWQVLVRRKETKGQVIWLYVLLYGILRFAMETLRGDDRGAMHGGLSPSQLIALAAILVSGSIFLVQATSKHVTHA